MTDTRGHPQRPLSPQERAFFSLLCERYPEPVLVVDLLNACDSDADNDLARVVVSRLRSKLGVEIHCHRGRHGAGRGSGAYSLGAKL